MITQAKFAIIQETVSLDNNVLSIEEMCRLANVSRSGYYNWLHAAPKRRERSDKDKSDFELILEAYNYRGYWKGARSIYMRMLHTGQRMNLKKIRRLMQKYGLKCPYRGPNPYRRLANAMKTNRTFPNIVDREFFKAGIRKTLLTDITYIFYRNKVCYLSTILDAYTREILAYKLSENLQVEFVLDTVDRLIREHGSTLDDTINCTRKNGHSKKCN